jgi:sialate O-acetylesterase
MPEDDSPPWKGDGLAPTRDAQRRCLKIPHTGMAVIIDLEGDRGWHPKNKQDVAKRLALWARRNEYGHPQLVASGPLFAGIGIEGATIRVRFTSTGSGLVVGSKSGIEPLVLTPGEPLRNFTIASEDKVWVNATAVIDGTDVLVTAPQVPHPVAVRYAHCQDPKGCNLYNKEGLPASPFRSDAW